MRGRASKLRGDAYSGTLYMIVARSGLAGIGICVASVSACFRYGAPRNGQDMFPFIHDLKKIPNDQSLQGIAPKQRTSEPAAMEV